MKKRRILRSERGFTLVELGIVMAIIAILAAVAYPTYTGIRNRAYVAEAKAMMQEVRVDVWALRIQSGDWPLGGTDGLVTVPTAPNWIIAVPTTAVGATEKYTISATAQGDAPSDWWVVLSLKDTGEAKFFEGKTGTPTAGSW